MKKKTNNVVSLYRRFIYFHHFLFTTHAKHAWNGFPTPRHLALFDAWHAVDDARLAHQGWIERCRDPTDDALVLALEIARGARHGGAAPQVIAGVVEEGRRGLAKERGTREAAVALGEDDVVE